MKTVILGPAALFAIACAAPVAAQANTPEVYQAELCNNHDETIYFVLGAGYLAADDVSFGIVTEGWLRIDAGDCKEFGLPKNISEQQELRSRIFVYGETKGLFGGAIKKVWEGDDVQGCVKRAHDEYFSIRSVTVGQAVILRHRCDGEDEFEAGMTELKPDAQDQLYFGFGGQ